MQKIIQGDCLDVMRTMEDNSIDLVVCDPPYGLNFMGKIWDDKVPNVEVWIECLRICKPGSMLASFGGSRTHHHLMLAIERAGWEIRDVIMWLYGSGFPKSHNISKAIDKEKGEIRKKIKILYSTNVLGGGIGIERPWKEKAKECGYCEVDDNQPISKLSNIFNGYGTALKPAYEPIIIAMKPLDGTYAQNAEKWGVGGINIESSRVFSPHLENNLETLKYDSEFFSSIELCRNALFGISSVLRPCNNFCKDHLHNDLNQDGTLISVAEYESLSTLLYPNGVWCGLIWSLIPDSQSDCQVYRRLYDELLPNALKNARFSAPLLGDALDDIFQYLLSLANSHYFYNDHPSISDVLNLLHAFLKPLFNPSLYLSHQKKSSGRWPANLILDEESAEALDLQTGVSKSAKGKCNAKKVNPLMSESKGLHTPGRKREWEGYADSGGASRFFYIAKASSSERNAGLEGLPDQFVQRPWAQSEGRIDAGNQISSFPKKNNHPTVKPLALMRYIIKLLAPPGDPVCLDPFCGSGSTCLAAKQLGIRAIGIEKEVEYCEIANARINSCML